MPSVFDIAVLRSLWLRVFQASDIGID